MRGLHLKFLILTSFFSTSALAQMLPTQWGSGMYGGTQQCGHEYYSADDVIYNEEGVQEARADYDELMEELYEDFEVKNFERDLKKAKSKLKKYLKSGTMAYIDDILKNDGNVEYKPCQDSFDKCKIPDATTSAPAGSSTPEIDAILARLRGGNTTAIVLKF